MASKESHPIRNGIIATVVGGAILNLIFPSLRELSVKFVKWVWSGVVWVGDKLAADYNIEGWVLLILGCLALIGIVRIYNTLKPENRPEFKYTEDMIHGVKWRWKWNYGQINNLWCFCPTCDATLVYDDSSCKWVGDNCHTDFICENCGHQIVATVNGGNKNYAVDAAEREIHRRIRTNEYTKTDNKPA